MAIKHRSRCQMSPQHVLLECYLCEMFDEARQFILECYGMGNYPNLHDARVQAWEKKMKRNSLVPPKLCALPPTEAAFQQNVLRAHLAAATMFDCHNPSPPT